MKPRLPRTSHIRWSSNSRLLQTVSMYHSDVHMAFRVIGDAEDKWDNDSVMKAAGFERWHLKTNTCFLIMAYEEIFNKTDALFTVLQKKINGYCIYGITTKMKLRKFKVVSMFKKDI